MDMCEYNNHKYNLIDLIILNANDKIPEYKNGSVKNIRTKEEFDINDSLDKYQDKIKDMIESGANFSSSEQMNDLFKIYNKKFKDIILNEYQDKLDKNEITLEEIDNWKRLMPYKDRKDFAILNYKSFVVMNLEIDKPKELSFLDYGRFTKLLHIMNYQNKITHKNGKPIKKSDLVKDLEFNSIKSLDRFLQLLRKNNLIVQTDKTKSNISYIIVNPLYAMKHTEIDCLTYNFFKEDLDKVLTPLEKKYLELKGEEHNSIMSIKTKE